MTTKRRSATDDLIQRAIERWIAKTKRAGVASESLRRKPPAKAVSKRRGSHSASRAAQQQAGMPAIRRGRGTSERSFARVGAPVALLDEIQPASVVDLPEPGLPVTRMRPLLARHRA